MYYAINFYLKVVPIVNFFGLIFFAIFTAIIILFSIFFHELAHTIVSLHYGLNTKEIELNFLGGFTKLETEPITPKSEKHIALAGPLLNIVIGAIILASFLAFHLRIHNYFLASLFFAGVSNVAIGVFNLIPAYPLDGGRILRAHFWSKSKDYQDATYLAYKISILIGYSFTFYAIYLFFILEFVNALWILLIGILIIYSAKYAYNNSSDKIIKKVYESKLKKPI